MNEPRINRSLFASLEVSIVWMVRWKVQNGSLSLNLGTPLRWAVFQIVQDTSIQNHSVPIFLVATYFLKRPANDKYATLSTSKTFPKLSK